MAHKYLDNRIYINKTAFQKICLFGGGYIMVQTGVYFGKFNPCTAWRKDLMISNRPNIIVKENFQ